MKTFFAIAAFVALITIASSHTVTFDHFWTLQEIDEYLEELLEDFPTLFSREELAVTTSEGRPINAYRVSKPNGVTKPVILVESGLRPREWLSNMAVLYFIHELVEHDYEFPDLLASVDFVFIPVSNPDGYAFSFTSGNRAWNKNRRVNSGSTCLGVDINRNFEYQFLASSNPCDDNFSGTTFASEAETRAIDTIIKRINPRVFVSVQAGRSQILYPYNAYTFASIEEPRFRQLAQQVNAGMSESYSIGAAGVLNGVERGTVLDYTYYELNVPFSYIWRLPSGLSNAWDFPATRLTSILPDIFNGFLVFAENTRNA